MDAEDIAQADPQSVSPQVVIERQACLSQRFKQLCNELACPQLARAYGSDFHRDATDASQPRAKGSDDAIPKKGSLRVFAQQARLFSSGTNFTPAHTFNCGTGMLQRHLERRACCSGDEMLLTVSSKNFCAQSAAVMIQC